MNGITGLCERREQAEQVFLLLTCKLALEDLLRLRPAMLSLQKLLGVEVPSLILRKGLT